MGSLQQMLDYQNDDFEEAFEQTFCIGYSDVFGQSHTYDLKEDGASVPVSQANKQVHDVVDAGVLFIYKNDAL